MNDSEDVPKKTSRRRFTKTAASALVAMPVIASLSSCKEKSGPPPSPPGTPTPTPTRTPSPESSNPPIIIDGGSLSILIVPRFEKDDDDTTPPAVPPFKFKHFPDDDKYRVISRIKVISDDATLLLDYPLASDTEVVEVSIWVGTYQEYLADDFQYDKVDVTKRADMIVTCGRTSANKLLIRTDEEIKNPKKSAKKKGPPTYRQYFKKDWKSKGSKDFRIAAVGVKVGQTVLLEPDKSEYGSDYGFKIVFFVP